MIIALNEGKRIVLPLVIHTKMPSAFKKLYRLLLDALFPCRCAGCDKLGNYLCLDCELSLCPAREHLGDDTIAIFDYRDPKIRQLLWLLKYRGVRDIGAFFGHLLYDNSAEWLADELALYPRSGQTLVLPAPLSRERFRQRGYNQSALIAKNFAERDSKNFRFAPKLLLKKKNTRSQVELKDRQARLDNLHGAFAVADKKKIRGKIIILIDDVTTTGTTLAECAHVLKSAGARRVISLAVAHG